MSQRSDSNLYGFSMRMMLCLLVLSCSSTVVDAQENPDTPAPSTESQDAKPATLVMPTYSQNVALLGTDQRYLDLLTLQTRRRTFFMYGMGVSESYNNFEGSSVNQDNSALLWSPHFAIVNASNHSSFSFQYAPSLVQSTSGPSSREVFHAGTISFGQPIAPNWVLQLSSSNTYGTDASRLLSPLAFDVNKKGVPIADPSSAVFQFNRGRVFTTSESVGLSWQRNASQAMSFSVQESYFSPLNAGPSGRSTFAQVSYSAAVSPRTSLSVGGNYHHQGFSVGSCDGYGFSFGISHQVGRYLDISVSGGPEFGCSRGLGGNYGISISYPLSRRSRVGLSASRSYATNYLANTQWSDNGAVSYSRQLSESVGLSLNSGVSRSVRAPTSLGTYVGYFAGASVSWRLSRTISLGTEYRRFAQVSGGPNQGQNDALISLAWSPLPMRIVK